MLEKEIENQILEYLNHLGLYCWKNQSVGVWDQRKKIYRRPMNKFHRNGVADILGILPDGRLLAIEVKSAKGRLSDHQKEFLKNVEDNNGLAIVARSLDDLHAVVACINNADV